VVKALVEAFVADMRRRVAACAAAAQGGDLAGLLDQAHALKATASTYGAMALHHAVVAIETAGRGGDAQGCLALAGRLPTLVEPTEAALDRWLDDTRD
jgi:HPt (histidine-containing phosphotransfer) domain-containing protein